MAKKIRVVKCIFIASIIIILNTINSFAGNVLYNSQASTILSMPIVKILIVGFAGIIIVSLLYNVSQETENYSKGFAEKDEKDEKIENDNYYINEYNKKNKDTSINQEIIDKANEEEKPKYREEYIRESKLDQELLEEITQLYNEENEEKNDIKDVKDLKLEDDIKNDKEENEELETDKIKEEKGEEKLKDEPKKTRERKKAEENTSDNLAEDFLNNLDMTMRKG